MTAGGFDGYGKQEIRRRVRAARRERPVSQRLADDRARTGLVLAALRDIEPATISCYLSVPPHATNPEPGTIELVTALWTLGHRLLVPVLTPTSDGPRHDPAWAVFQGPANLKPGLWGIPEPSGEAQGAEALGQADLVLASGLAGTRDGRRLGVGGGWYDRALAHRRDDVEVWVLLNDDEVLPDLPTEPHDQVVDALVLPGELVRCHA
ncbi:MULTISPECIES: 5-formyltetrahydrofolate cyclo-ligase [unclassified Luteococcus]|uniref:5-formyltetrahydrofolate cyclo-ligase n=1 Tax=unclassified Luteococcus TaxID=2639923 RepID=UPI00313CD213